LRHTANIWGAVARTSDLTTISDIECPAPSFNGATPTQVTTLANGLKVASSDLSLPCSTVGMYIDTGSAHETVSGTAHLLQHMAFKSSAEHSHMKAFRSTERLGWSTATVGRESMVYQLDTQKSQVPEAAAMLADTIFDPKMLAWEVDEAKTFVQTDLEERLKNPQLMVQDFCHTAAFGSRSPLGRPLACPSASLGSITPGDLSAFVSEQYVPNRMVFAAAGYEHQELVRLAESLFGHLPMGASAPTVSSEYVGGEYRESAAGDLTHFALSFKGVGWNSDSLVPMCVLNTVMGGGASFSAGGPGKGMYTRLYQNILNRFAYVEAASAFSAFYNDTGVFGIYCAAPSEGVGQLAQVVCEEMTNLTKAVSPVELSRAKNQLSASLLMNLESRPVLFEDIGRQVLSYGARTTPETLVAQINAVTADDLVATAQALLAAPPSVAVYGDTTCLPRYDIIARHVQST